MIQSARRDQLKYRRLAVDYELSLRTRACSSAVEQGTHNPLVGGSNPSGPTTSAYDARVIPRIWNEMSRYVKH